MVGKEIQPWRSAMEKEASRKTQANDPGVRRKKKATVRPRCSNFEGEGESSNLRGPRPVFVADLQWRPEGWRRRRELRPERIA